MPRRTENRIRISVNWTLHPELVKALQRRAQSERTPMGKRRSISSIVEQALAEYLAIPLANEQLPQAPLELCPTCEQGVLRDGICRICNWRRNDPRPPHRRPRPRATPTP